MIDYTKAIEYVDGSPATYCGRYNNYHRVTRRGSPDAVDSCNHYDDNGNHAYGDPEKVSIRNVDPKSLIEAAIDLLTRNNYTVTPPPAPQALRDAVAQIFEAFSLPANAASVRIGNRDDLVLPFKDMIRHG